MKADIYGNIVYLILHFPIYDISRRVSEPCEVDFILGKNFIITAHYKSIIPRMSWSRYLKWASF